MILLLFFLMLQSVPAAYYNGLEQLKAAVHILQLEIRPDLQLPVVQELANVPVIGNVRVDLPMLKLHTFQLPLGSDGRIAATADADSMLVTKVHVDASLVDIAVRTRGWFSMKYVGRLDMCLQNVSLRIDWAKLDQQRRPHLRCTVHQAHFHFSSQNVVSGVLINKILAVFKERLAAILAEAFEDLIREGWSHEQFTAISLPLPV